VTRRSWQDSLATRPKVLSFRTGPEPSLVRHFLPATKDAFSRKLTSPQRGRGLHLLLPGKVKGLAWCPAMPCRTACREESFPGNLLQASLLDSFQEIVRGKGMPPWQSFQRCRSRSSHDIFEKLCRRSSPCLHHAFGVSSLALLSAGFLPPPMGDECHGPGYM
jgi:hypothetical protein